MTMITHNIEQGSPEWHSLRASYFCASEAAAMLGLSDKMTRNELLRMKATGTEKEYSDFTLRLFEKGHQAEAATRPIIEEKIGEDLYPVTGSREIDGLPLLASFDGITMEDTLIWENKIWNESLSQRVINEDIPDTHWPQLEQQAIVSGVEVTYFSVYDYVKNRFVKCYYKSRPERRALVIAGWKQFAVDLKNYKPDEVIFAEPAPVKSIDDLPVLAIDLTGEVRHTNIALFKSTALDFVASINTDLKTDEDFAHAENVVKFCAEAEKRLKIAKDEALKQTTSIDQLFRGIDEIREEMRKKRLALENLVKDKKQSIRFDLIKAAEEKLKAHIAELNKRFGKALMPTVPANFVGTIKGKSKIDSINAAIDACLADAQVSANMIADRITANLAMLDEIGKDYPALVHDLPAIASKESADFIALVRSRISVHKEAEQAKAQAPTPSGPHAPVAQLVAAIEQVKAAVRPTTEELDTSVITAFMKTRDFGKNENLVRAALVEFLRFMKIKEAA